MDVVPFPARPSPGSFVTTPHARAYLLAPTMSLPDATDLVFALADATRFAYAPTAPGGVAHEAAIDPFARGNKFQPLHESDLAQSALLSIAAGRRVDTGPDTERMFVFLRGAGLLFDETGDTHRFEPHTVAVAPAGIPVRVWSQGPEDTLAVAIQPKASRAPRRTLGSEIRRIRSAEARAEGPK